MQYLQKSFKEAKELNWASPWNSGWESFSEDELFLLHGIWKVEYVDLGYEFVASDGGDPEDQTLSRDWAWVVGALNNAYQEGLKDGRSGL
jgi:hypothetical protein